MDLQLNLAPLQEAKNHTRARARVRNTCTLVQAKKVQLVRLL